jgi:hypothetical protein
LSSSGRAVVKAENESGPAEGVREWSLPTRFAFRFGFCYYVLCIYPNLLGLHPIRHNQNNLVWQMWDRVVPWVGANLLHLAGPLSLVAKESGDQLYDYILWLCIFSTAIIAATIWSLLDRKRKQYDRLCEWLRVLVRLTLSLVMIDYGIAKLFRAQFPELSLVTLLDTYGQSSPQGLLWAFMKYSRPYSFFGGLGETLGGILLTVPRFATLGTLITLGMVSNVLMLNFSYDVPRKILCIHLLLMCIFLLWPDIRRLFGFFVLHRSEQLPAPRPLFREKALNKTALFLQPVIGILIILTSAHSSYVTSVRPTVQIGAPLRGIWEVDQFNFDGLPRSPLLTDTVRWRRVILEGPELLTIQLMDDTRQQFLVQWNGQKTNGSLWGTEDHSMKGNVTVENLRADGMVLEAQIAGHRVEAQLRRVDLSDPTKFLLINRGFHWIN